MDLRKLPKGFVGQKIISYIVNYWNQVLHYEVETLNFVIH